MIVAVSVLETVADDINQEVSQANQDAIEIVSLDNNEYGVTINGALNSFASTNITQGTGQWIGLVVNTGESDITSVLYNGVALTEEDVLEKLTEAQKADTTFAGYFAVENMPAQYRPMWESLNTERKVEIARQSKMYDFTKQGILESFWAGVKFENNKPVNESTDVVDNYHAGIAAQMRRMMHK